MNDFFTTKRFPTVSTLFREISPNFAVRALRAAVHQTFGSFLEIRTGPNARKITRSYRLLDRCRLPVLEIYTTGTTLFMRRWLRATSRENKTAVGN